MEVFISEADKLQPYQAVLDLRCHQIISLTEALQANNMLCGNNPALRQGARYKIRQKSLQPHLHLNHINLWILKSQ